MSPFGKILLYMQIHMSLLGFVALLGLLLKMLLPLFQVLVAYPGNVCFQEKRAHLPKDSPVQAVPGTAGRIYPSVQRCLFLHL